ncbi:C1 family peptidase [Mucilaginibacter myungsuensis]|uniref:Aminopeptidase n=1 Tax=Mucilaginibacter myungsuensis TaxID=649104 RepID=A0A929L584_9SPHI|nr:C1 family peptidase [Mucilaginibacter myungsuensis]MBE9664694.1 aminopeptidase [Mucilaginibacter myungsuensis]MDN3601449.1 C1 family peptidase [Mucilaginibacter myungsuensis]
MKKILTLALYLAAGSAFAQTKFAVIKNNPATPVKSQGNSGTCWCFSSTALIESELLFKKQPESDISEVFTVYNLYVDKAENFVRRRGNARFTEGGIQQDMIYSTDRYGAVPQEIYPGVGRDTVLNRDGEMEGKLKGYIDDLLKKYRDTIPLNWQAGYKKILDSYLGAPPEKFTFQGKEYTPKTYATEKVGTKLSDYIGLTSFTHHPYNTSFAMEVPDNYNSHVYYNVPLDEFISTVKAAINKGYTLAWDADVSNNGFQQNKGYAKWTQSKADAQAFDSFTEQKPTAAIRQQLFDKQQTTDDHLMQITGLAKDEKGNEYFIVKNSWGKNAGPHGGYIYVSVPYFAINTISVVVNKKALASTQMSKLAE